MLVLAASALTLAGSATSAAADFCDTSVIHDYAKALKRLPSIHPPPLREHLAFAPSRVFLNSRSSSGSLQLGPGERGFHITYAPYEEGVTQPIHLGWRVTARLVHLDRRGRRIGRPEKIEKSVKWLRPESETFHGLDFSFDVAGQPALYRLELLFENNAGKRLGRFGENFRVLRPSLDVDISLDATSYHRGETLRATLNNRGVAFLSFGLSRLIEYWDGATWTQPPVQFPGGPVPAIGLVLGPGESSSCWSVAIPQDAVPGTYRFVENVGHSHGGFSPPSRNPLEVSAEFAVTE